MIGEIKKTLRLSVVVLAALIPVLVVFRNNYQNIDVKLWLLTITGVLAWTYVALDRFSILKRLVRPVRILLAIFLVGCAASVIASVIRVPGSWDFLYGSANHRIGLLTLLACIGVGLVFSEFNSKRLLNGLYLYAVGLAGLSLAHDLLFGLHAGRLAGTALQADAMGVCLGAGFIIGLYRLKKPLDYRLAVAQVFLLLCLFMTQTRAVIILVALIGLLVLCRHRPKQKRSMLVIFTIVFVVIAGLVVVLPRVTNPGYLSRSITYRLDLQAVGVRALWHMPPLGYGVNSLYFGTLSCSNMHDAALLKTCAQGFGFDSTHNIYLDRVLELGWIAGVAYVVLFTYVLWSSFQSKNRELMPFLAVGALVFVYYFTNITTIDVELLAWIVLLFLAAHLHEKRSRRLDSFTARTKV